MGCTFHGIVNGQFERGEIAAAEHNMDGIVLSDLDDCNATAEGLILDEQILKDAWIRIPKKTVVRGSDVQLIILDHRLDLLRHIRPPSAMVTIIGSNDVKWSVRARPISAEKVPMVKVTGKA